MIANAGARTVKKYHHNVQTMLVTGKLGFSTVKENKEIADLRAENERLKEELANIRTDRRIFEDKMEFIVNSEINEMLMRIGKKYPGFMSDMKIVDSGMIGIKRKDFLNVKNEFAESIKSAIRWREWTKEE